MRAGRSESPDRLRLDQRLGNQSPSDSAIMRQHSDELQLLAGGSIHQGQWDHLFDRLDALGIKDSRVFVNFSPDELREAWDGLEEPHGQLKGPGSARTQIEFWHQRYTQWLFSAPPAQSQQAQTSRPVEADASADAIRALAESNKQLVHATKRLDSRRRRPLEDESESDPEEIDLGSILQEYVT